MKIIIKFLSNLTIAPKPPIIENTDGYSLEKSITRLFQFIEIESNISLEKLEGTYQALKQKIYEKLQDQYDVESETEINNRPMFVRKREQKQQERQTVIPTSMALLDMKTPFFTAKLRQRVPDSPEFAKNATELTDTSTKRVTRSTLKKVRRTKTISSPF